jgi:hypothetical protein
VCALCRRVDVLEFLVVIAVAAVALFPSSCRGSRNTTVPEELKGTWTTTDPRYEGRFFEFTARGSLRVGTGDDNVDVYTIWDIESEREDAFVRYAVTYLSVDAQEYRFHFYYDPFDEGMIRFIHQELKWKREKE